MREAAGMPVKAFFGEILPQHQRQLQQELFHILICFLPNASNLQK
jgi:hypothetical protein